MLCDLLFVFQIYSKSWSCDCGCIIKIIVTFVVGIKYQSTSSLCYNIWVAVHG